MKRFLAVLMIFSCTAPSVKGQNQPVTLTLDDYVQQAIRQGIRGQETAMTFESAGYARTAAFRKTDSPTLTLSGSETQTENYGEFTTASTINPLTGVPAASSATGWTSPTRIGQTSLALNEPLPSGTILSATGLYGDTAGKPGFNASIVQPLYVFVKNPVMRTRERAALNFSNAKNTFDAVVLAIRSQARSFYYGVMLGEESIKVADRKKSSSQKLLELTQALVDAGKTAAVETMRAKIRVQTDDRQLQNATVVRDKAILSAKNFIHMPLDESVHFSTQLEFHPFSLPLERLVQYALLHRPELQSLAHSKELARLDYDAAAEPTRPTLSLNSTYQHTELAPSGVSKAWTAAGGANWLLFDSFVTSNQARVARIGLAVAELNLSDAERTTQLDVENAYLDIKKVEKQLVDFQSSREQASRNVEVIRLRFRNGLDRLIDVFDAENEMRDLDTEYLGLLVTYNQLKDNLSELLGVDVETLK